MAYHLLRHALHQPDIVREMENIRNSCVGNGSLQRRHPSTSSKTSISRPSEGIYSHIRKIPRHFITQRRRPVHIPNPLHPQLEAGTCCPIPPNTYLAHKPASRHKPPMSKLLLAYPDQTRQSSPPTSERKGRSHERRYSVLHPVLRGSVRDHYTSPSMPRRRSTIFEDVVCSLSCPPAPTKGLGEETKTCP